MSRRPFPFRNQDGQQLAGVLETPGSGDTRAVALFAHCFTCTKNVRAATHIARALAERGIATLRFDFTGLGESEGDFAGTGFSANVADLVAAAHALEAQLSAPSLLVGHSLGGAAALMAASRIAACRAVVAIGAPAGAAHVMKHLAGNLEAVREHGRARVDIGGRPFELSREFLEDLEAQPAAPQLADLKRALLVMHSPVDTVVGIDNAATIFEAARHPKSFVSLDRADHLLTDPHDSSYAASVIAAWAERYLPPAPAVVESGHEPGVTAVTGPQGLRTEIRAGEHRLVADEPVAVGGEDTGPTPYGLLSAALAACTSMTLQMYARHKQIPLDEVAVTVAHDKIHADDCEECETREGRIDRFERRIRLSGPLDAAQREGMLRIADRCPVHRTLHGEVAVRSRLED
jgi:putative redox protein